MIKADDKTDQQMQIDNMAKQEMENPAWREVIFEDQRRIEQ